MKNINLDVPEVKKLITDAKKKKLGWGIKFTKKNGCCFACANNNYKSVKYVVGKEVAIDNVDTSSTDCSTGIHLGKDFIGAGDYNIPERIFFCTFKKKDLYGEGADTWRVGKCLVVKELPQWLGYGPKGKEIIKKIGKKFTKAQLAKYNPYQATKLPTAKKIASAVRSQVEGQVWGQVGDQVWGQVEYQVAYQVRSQVQDQVEGQVWGQVRSQVQGKVQSQVWNQVRNQVRATSYWAVNIYFNLGISHWFGDFLKLGIMIVYTGGKAKVFGKKGEYLGEYDQEELK